MDQNPYEAPQVADLSNGIRKEQPPRFRISRVFWYALIVNVVGSAPLLLTILIAKLGFTKDPNPNPVHFGILFTCAFFPSILVILGSLAASFDQYRSERKEFHKRVP